MGQAERQAKLRFIMRNHQMFTRFAAAALTGLLLTGCEEADSRKPEQALVCKGLSEVDCTARTECSWNAPKAECNTR